MNPEIDKYGNKKWYNKDKQLHRTDGPAIEYFNGNKKWYLNGELHRTDGPTIEHTSGDKEWFQNGELHRTDGPALEYADGSKYWLLNGKGLSEKLHKELTGCPLEDLPLMLNKGFDDFIAERLKNEPRNR